MTWPSSAFIPTSSSPLAKAAPSSPATQHTPHACAACAIKAAAGTDWLDHAEPGYNYRLSDLACALGRVQLPASAKSWPFATAAAKRYDEILIAASIPGLELPPLTLPNRTISWFVYVVRLPEDVNRNQVRGTLATRGIATGRYFAPIHLQPAWRNHPSAAAASLHLTESIARRTLALPFFNRITSGQQQQVANALQDALSPNL